MRRSWRTALIVGAIVAVFAATSAGAAKFITGGDIQNGTIGLKDLSKRAKRALKGKTGPAGPAGATGATGPTGAQGPAGPSSLSTTIRAGEFSAPPEDFADGEVRCPAGMIATGGSLSPGALIPVFDAPSADGGGWVGSAFNFDSSSSFRMLIVVVCTPGSMQASPTSVKDQTQRLKAAARVEHGN
jgi:hypothetical protein